MNAYGLIGVNSVSYSPSNTLKGVEFMIYKDGMSVIGSLTLIPYFTAYLIHYFHNSKAWGDNKIRISDSESASKNTLINYSKEWNVV